MKCLKCVELQLISSLIFDQKKSYEMWAKTEIVKFYDENGNEHNRHSFDYYYCDNGHLSKIKTTNSCCNQECSQIEHELICYDQIAENHPRFDEIFAEYASGDTLSYYNPAGCTFSDIEHMINNLDNLNNLNKYRKERIDRFNSLPWYKRLFSNAKTE